MSELGELFKDLHKEGKMKREQNLKSSVEVLREKGIPFVELSDTHLRVGNFDFWPSTGLFIQLRTGRRGRGVFNLIKKLNPKQ